MNNKIVITRHVDVIEENANLTGFGGNEDNNSMNDLSDTDNLNKTENLTYSVKDNSIPEDINVISPNRKVDCNREEYELRKSERVKKRPEGYGDSTVYSSCIYVNIVSADSPLSFEDALKGSESELWKQAMDREISCLKKNKTWKLIQRPRNKEILDLKWIFTNKHDNRKKARLVVRGFQQLKC